MSCCVLAFNLNAMFVFILTVKREAGFAVEALAGLASKENFSKVELRKTEPTSLPASLATWHPFTDLMLLHVKGWYSRYSVFSLYFFISTVLVPRKSTSGWNLSSLTCTFLKGRVESSFHCSIFRDRCIMPICACSLLHKHTKMSIEMLLHLVL